MKQPYHSRLGRTGWAAPLLLLLLVSPPGWATRHALLIGVSDYSASGAKNLNDLPGTRNDLERIAQVLASRPELKPDDLVVLRDSQATHRNIEREFRALAQRVQPGDFVYIHYSGHGSRIPDPTKRKPSGQHQTWVSYGSRAPGSVEDDRYDILDNELNRWLKPIDEKAGELVYVADSCHAAGTARGEALPTRAAPSPGDHPLAAEPYQTYVLQHAVSIAAAREDKSAHEFKTDQDKPYGIFTWYWAQALEAVKPGETWQQLFDRTEAQVTRAYGEAQRPQIDGPLKGHPILGGAVGTQPRVMVTDMMVRDAAPLVTLNAGRLTGVTKDSLYRDQPGEAELQITQVYSNWSQAKVTRGTVKPGDFVAETEHVYPTSGRLKVWFLVSEKLAGSPLATAVQSLIPMKGTDPDKTQIQGYEKVDDVQEADLVLALLRPQRVKGEPTFSAGPQGPNTLPDEAADAPAEVWVLTPAQRRIHDNLLISLADEPAGLKTLRNNLGRYRRWRALGELAQETGGTGQVEIGLIAYERCSSAPPDCLRLNGHEDDPTGFRRLPGTQPLSALKERLPEQGRHWQVGDYLSFDLSNQNMTERYVYILDASPSGKISVIFPPSDGSPGDARLSGNQHRSLHNNNEGVGLLLDENGAEGLLVIVTSQPIVPFVLEQEGYESTAKSTTRGNLNPLERLLSETIEGRRGSSVGVSSGSFGSQWVGFEVQAARP